MRLLKKNKCCGVVLAVLSILACNPDKCLHGTGSRKTLIVETGYFHIVNIGAMYNYILIEDTSTYIEYSGGEDVLQYVQTSIADSVLFLNYSNSCFFLRDYEKIECKIHFNNLKRIEVGEACRIKSQNTITSNLFIAVSSPMAEIEVEMDNQSLLFYTHHATAGKYIFSGKTIQSTLIGYHTSKIDASKLESIETTIENHSIADYYVNVNNKLWAGIFNKGSIFYSGLPKIIIDSIAGTGKILPAIQN